MTTPALVPELNGHALTVDGALKRPQIIRDRIAELAQDQLLTPYFFRPGAAPEAGAIAYERVRAASFFDVTGVELRQPGQEYRTVEGLEEEPRLALVEDWGGKFRVEDERVERNDRDWFDDQVTALTNSVVAKIDQRAHDALVDALDETAAENTIVSTAGWENLVFEGPATGITPSNLRPTADISAAQMAAELQELGVVHDTLIVHPNQAHRLRSAYGDQLQAMLDSTGLKLVSNTRAPAGTAYVTKHGEAGVVGFEKVLTVEVVPDRLTRSRWVQVFCVPAFAVRNPNAVKRITGLE